jgi:hypothetical protein
MLSKTKKPKHLRFILGQFGYLFLISSFIPLPPFSGTFGLIREGMSNLTERNMIL